MNFRNILFTNPKYYLCIFSSLLLSGFFPGFSVVAESNVKRADKKTPLSLETFSRKTQSDRKWGRPPSRTSGGSRNACQQPLIALVPGKDMVNNQACQGESLSFMIATLLPNPIIWIYVPSSLTSQLGELVILDSQQHSLSSSTITLPSTEGIIGLQLNYPLEIDQGYRWQLSAVIDAQSPAQNPTVEGLITRISLISDLNKQVSIAKSEREIANLYARAGIWQDALTSLGQLRCGQHSDTNIEDDWSNLLDIGGLKAIASNPIVNCNQLSIIDNQSQFPSKT